MRKIELDPEEWLRLKAVSQQEKMDAMEQTAKWVTFYMKKQSYSREYGPLSDEEMDGKAAIIIPTMAYAKLFKGEQHWKKDRTLVVQMIYTSKSIISHLVRDYYDKGKDLASTESSLSEHQQRKVQAAFHHDFSPHLREFGYEQARNAVRGMPVFEAYIDALEKERCYLGISKRMKLSVEEVMVVEKELLAFLDK